MTNVIAHRGASRAERENTLVAFRRAVTMGADGVELDARRTADGSLVVHHDPHLADGRAIVATDAAQLPDHVPSLADALDASTDILVNIEIKNDPSDPDYDDTCSVADAVVALVRASGRTGTVLVSSFDLATIDRVRSLAPALATAWLVEEADDVVLATLLDHGHRVLHPWVGSLTASLVASAHALGIEVNTWTCDDPDRMVELAGWGIDGICTNVPDVALAALGRRRS